MIGRKPHSQWVIERLARKVQRLKADNRAMLAAIHTLHSHADQDEARIRDLLDRIEQANKGYGPVHVPRP